MSEQIELRGGMVELTADELWRGSGCVLVCSRGHRWGAWLHMEGARCIAEVSDSAYTNGLCGEFLCSELRREVAGHDKTDSWLRRCVL